MGKRSTIKGYWRAAGADSASSSQSGGPSIAVLPLMLAVTVDAAATDGTGTGKFLPAGAIVLKVDVVSGHSGGTGPLLNIGITGTVDGFLNGVVADGNVNANLTAVLPATGAVGAEMGVVQAADIEIVAGTGGGTPGTGASEAYVYYTIEDDGVANN